MTVDAAFSASILFYLAILVLVAWGALLALRGDFWRADQRLVEGEFQPGLWPTVAVVVPARNEADVIEESLLSIAAQRYEGTVRIFLVGDRSGDDTARLARKVPGVTVRRARLLGQFIH